MKFIESARQWFLEKKASIVKKLEEKAEARRIMAAEHELDIREFNGELYIAYDNIPVVNVHHLNDDCVKILFISRETLVEFKKKYC